MRDMTTIGQLPARHYGCVRLMLCTHRIEMLRCLNTTLQRSIFCRALLRQIGGDGFRASFPLPRGHSVNARIQSAIRLTNGMNITIAHSGEKPIRPIMRPKGYATAAIMTMNQSQWKGPYPYIQPSIIIGASEQHRYFNCASSPRVDLDHPRHSVAKSSALIQINLENPGDAKSFGCKIRQGTPP